ncbi:MAG: 23S rRNA (adenine(2503)-C(2))-methyltransferase RlmN [Phycisphaera sp.]|nr:23S rRNA (adenine(2503)-C(2))-methyltransferase RlmN [Phycisphaera sp.]
MHDGRVNLFDLDRDAFTSLVQEHGLPRFRATQVLSWVYEKRVADFDAMTNLSKADRETLGSLLRIGDARVVRHQQATDGVQKLLVQWPRVHHESAHDARPLPQLGVPTQSHETDVDDPKRQTECVMIPTEDRKTACVSSQIGCPVGCRFCASGLSGLDGNLTTGQIVEQVWRLGTLENVERISHVVFMGMGEPMANFDAVVRAVRTLMADWALGISGRRITISTVGLPAQIRRLADLELPVTLAISLHAPNDEVRRRLIPWAEYVTVEKLIEAGRYYFEKTGREVTLEYTLLHGENDQPHHARELAKVAQTLRSHVNLIRYNEVKTLPFQRPEDHDVLRFQTLLRQAGINTHIRASRGRDIAAACGQLRHETKNAVG